MSVAVSAATDRADQVLAAHTAVSVDYFHRLIVALDEPLVANDVLRRAATRRSGITST